MKESDIRPHDVMDGAARAMEADLNWLRSRQDEFIIVDCPACGASSYEYRFEKKGIIYVTCGDCDTLYVNPRPSQALLDAFYAGSENYAYWNAHVFPASEENRRRHLFRPRAEKVRDFCVKYDIATEVLMEVGAGFGTFCQEIQAMELFHRIIAIEPTPDLAWTCRNRGLEVLEMPVEHITMDSGTVNVVVSFEVIEHLFHPGRFIAKCHHLLAPNGLLIVTCPNWKGFDIQALGPMASAVDHEHLNYFHPQSLTHLLESHGFEVLETLTPGKLDAELVRNAVVNGHLDVSDQWFLKRVLVDEWDRLGEPFQKFLSENGLSSHLWAVARKP